MCTRYSLESGIPATNFIPQRGHEPGVFELTSRSIGQIKLEAGLSSDDRAVLAHKSGNPSAQELCAEGASGAGTNTAQAKAATTSARRRTMSVHYLSVPVRCSARL